MQVIGENRNKEAHFTAETEAVKKWGVGEETQKTQVLQYQMLGFLELLDWIQNSAHGLVAVVVRLERSSGWYAKVLGLVLLQFCQLDTQVRQVQRCNLLVQL